MPSRQPPCPAEQGPYQLLPLTPADSLSSPAQPLETPHPREGAGHSRRGPQREPGPRLPECRVQHPACHPHSCLPTVGQRSLYRKQEPKEGPLISCSSLHSPFQGWGPCCLEVPRDSGQGHSPLSLPWCLHVPLENIPFAASERHFSPLPDQHRRPQINLSFPRLHQILLSARKDLRA